MAHSTLPGQLIYEPADAVVGFQQSGWQITAAPDPLPPETPPEGLEEPPEKPSSSRRAGRLQDPRGTDDEGKE